jgi:hypothetical protein
MAPSKQRLKLSGGIGNSWTPDHRRQLDRALSIR